MAASYVSLTGSRKRQFVVESADEGNHYVVVAFTKRRPDLRREALGCVGKDDVERVALPLGRVSVDLVEAESAGEVLSVCTVEVASNEDKLMPILLHLAA